MMKMLNIACGGRFHSDWVNIDFSPLDKRVKKVNLLKRLPFDDESFEVAYSSHFLEHLNREGALALLGEIWRVLKPRGILRIVVPDMENMAKAYLNALSKLDSIDSASNGGGGSDKTLESRALKEQLARFEYEFIILEIFDQMVRMKSGGELQKCYDMVREARNEEFAKFIQYRTGEDCLRPSVRVAIPLRNKITFDKIFNKLLNYYLKALRALIPRSLRDEIFIATSVGERHKWAYDRHSMGEILARSGFVEIKKERFDTSQIPHFNDYLLDINADKSPYKGAQSLYMECVKP